MDSSSFLKIILTGIVFLICNIFGSTNGHEKREFAFQRKVTFDNTFVSSDILWTRKPYDIFACSIECLADPLCNSYFYDGSTCSGYNKLEPVAGDMVTLTGVVFYTKRFKAEVECVGYGAIKDSDNFRCFKTGTTQMSWTDAELTCQGENGHLAILGSSHSISLLSSVPEIHCGSDHFAPAINKCFWLKTTLDSWTDSVTHCTSNGGLLAHTFPDNDTYFPVISGLGITDSSDTWWIGFEDTASEVDFRAPDGSQMVWRYLVGLVGYFNKDCLFIKPTEAFKWAEDDCDVGLHKAVCEKGLSLKYWVGGSDSLLENTWKWNNGEIMDMSQWHGTQPDGNTAENCAVLWYNGNGNKFSDEDCSQTLGYICEIPFK